ncbi:glutaredoxin domain-containing protein [Bacteroidota bacterium]
MKPVVYISNRCHQCGMVKKFVKEFGIDAKIYNVDLRNAKPPVDIFVYPALFVDEQLVAYGEDIIAYFKERLLNS